MADEWDAREAGAALLADVTRAITDERAQAADVHRPLRDADLARAVLRSPALQDANRKLLDSMEAEYKPRIAALVAAEAGPLIEAATADLRSRLADADDAIGEVIQHVRSWAMDGKALDPAEVERVLVSYGALRPWAGMAEGPEQASPVAADPALPQIAGQLPLPETEPGHA